MAVKLGAALRAAALTPPGARLLLELGAFGGIPVPGDDGLGMPFRPFALPRLGRLLSGCLSGSLALRFGGIVGNAKVDEGARLIELTTETVGDLGHRSRTNAERLELGEPGAPRGRELPRDITDELAFNEDLDRVRIVAIARFADEPRHHLAVDAFLLAAEDPNEAGIVVGQPVHLEVATLGAVPPLAGGRRRATPEQPSQELHGGYHDSRSGLARGGPAAHAAGRPFVTRTAKRPPPRG